MTKRVGALGACSALAVALLLSGCTQPATPAHTVAAAAAPVPTPTPTPVETYPTCASMVPASTISSIDPKLVLQPSRGYSIAPPFAGAAPNTRAEFMTAVYPPSSTTVLAGLQAGYFNCAWSDAQNYYLGVAVLPSGSAAFDGYRSAQKYDIASFDGLDEGDRSYGGCKNGDGQSCEIETLSGTTWIAAEVTPSQVSAATAPEIRAQLESVIRASIADVIAAGTLVSAQKQPSSHWQALADCSTIVSAIRTIEPSATSTLEKQTLDFTDAYDPLFRAGVDQSGAFSCSNTAAEVTVLPGAEIMGPLVYTSDATAPVAVSIPGVLNARDSCVAFEKSQCWTEGYVDHALVTVTGQTSPAERHAILAAVAAG
ncbi:MAG TPA: hypothetical protein VGI08_04825 [Diaminobutyricibacter sp.]